MLIFLCKKLYQKRGLVNGASTPISYFVEIPSVSRPISTTSKNPNSPLTISYLMSSCGLTEQQATSLSQKVHLESTSKSDSVLALLRKHGFTKMNISKCVLRRPSLLLADPDKTLKPKLDFFHSIGLFGPDFVKVVISDTSVLFHSLNKQIIPSFSFLKSIVGSNVNVVKMLSRSTWVLKEDPEKHMVPNIMLLRSNGVPEENIAWLLTTRPRMLLRSADQFNFLVELVKEMSFDPLKSKFLFGIIVLSSMRKQTWEAKLEVCRKWGWSEEEFQRAFVFQPNFMISSQKKIACIMDFLVNKMGYEPSLVAQHPNLLMLSLEKRIIPRCSVMHLLVLKSLIKKDFNLLQMLVRPEKFFLENYVTKFEKEAPELLDVYQGKVQCW